MKRLTLLRHAKTEVQHSGQEDWDRELEPRGQKDAPEMARRLRERKLKPDRIVTSPAVRALARILMARLPAAEEGPVNTRWMGCDELLRFRARRDDRRVLSVHKGGATTS